VLEPICDEAWQGDALHDFILVHLYRLDCLQALNLGQQDVGIQIIVGKHEFLQFCEFFELVEVLVEDDQVETDVDQVHLLHRLVELLPLKDLQGVSVDI
jgi:hypothetical protein